VVPSGFPGPFPVSLGLGYFPVFKAGIGLPWDLDFQVLTQIPEGLFGPWLELKEFNFRPGFSLDLDFRKVSNPFFSRLEGPGFISLSGSEWV